MDRGKVIHAVETAFDVWIDEYTGCSWFKEDEVRQAKEDVLAMLKNEQNFRKVMFNRCATATMRVMDKNACGMCIFREDCEKERTVNPW